MNLNARRVVATLYLLHLIVTPVLGDPAAEETPRLTDVRADGDNIVFQLSRLVAYDAYLLDSPWRLVVEIPQAQYATGFKVKSVSTPLVSRVRGYQFKENPLVARLILD